MQRQPVIRVLFIGGYRPFRLRKAGGPNAVSSPLIDAFALITPKRLEITVLSTPFKEITLPVFRPTTLKLGKIVVKYMPLVTAIPVLINEIAKAHLIHVFAGGEPLSILIQLIAKMLGRKVIATFHGYIPMEFYFEGRFLHPLKRKLYDLLYWLSIKLSDAVTFVSNLLKSNALITLGLTEEETKKFHVIYNGTDLTPQLQDKPANEVVILTLTGGFPYRKGLDIVLNILSMFKLEIPVKLVIVGQVPRELTHLIELIKRNGTKLVILYRVSRAELIRYYDEAHICIQLSRFDSFLLPALEAASRGCGIVVSNRAGVSEILRGAAVVVDINDIK